MTEQQAEKAANIIIGLAIVVGAFAIVKIPTVRRTVWRATKTTVRAAGPWLVAEARRAWEQSEPRAQPAPRSGAGPEARGPHTVGAAGVEAPAVISTEASSRVTTAGTATAGELDRPGVTESARRTHAEGATPERAVRQPAI